MRRLIMIGLIVLGLALSGCATMIAQDIVPAQLVDRVQIPGMAGPIRIWGDGGPETSKALIEAEAGLLREKYADRARAQSKPVSHLLAISGGADDGAFGAGLLVGWGERGDRPAFDLVTGISADSLVAPFAYLGADYDRALSTIFVIHDKEEIYQTSVLSGALGGPSIADSAPLARLIERYVDRRMLAKVAAERAKGRFLLIGTTNLNAQRPVYWDMGRIAQADDDAALSLFRKVLLASTAIPGIFPPVAIDVTAGGKTYQEIHVDGGSTREVFLSPAEFSFKAIDAMVGRRITRHLWVIRNGKLAPEYAAVQLSAVSIASRSLETLTKNQGIGDLVRMHEKAMADGIDYNLAHIPSDFSAPRAAPFSSPYMRALYAKGGRELGRAGYPWSKAPPGLLTPASGR